MDVVVGFGSSGVACAVCLLPTHVLLSSVDSANSSEMSDTSSSTIVDKSTLSKDMNDSEGIVATCGEVHTSSIVITSSE